MFILLLMVLLICMFMIIVVFIFIFSSTFLFCWMLMESMVMLFLSLISFNSVNQKISSIISYFLIQALSSSIFLVSLMICNYDTMIGYLGVLIYNTSLIMKIGVFPFHSWVVGLANNMNWLSIGLLTTVQKFIPMIMLSVMISYNYMIVVSFVTMLISIYNSLGLVSVKMIFIYSILSHSSWMILVLLNMNVWLIYYILYSVLFMLICYINNYYNIEDLLDFSFMGALVRFVYIVNLVSLSGMPPLSGFYFKWMILDHFSGLLSYLYIYIFIVTSLIHFSLYIRVAVYSWYFVKGESKLIYMYFLHYIRSFSLCFVLTMIFNLMLLLIGFNLI